MGSLSLVELRKRYWSGDPLGLGATEYGVPPPVSNTLSSDPVSSEGAPVNPNDQSADAAPVRVRSPARCTEEELTIGRERRVRERQNRRAVSEWFYSKYVRRRSDDTKIDVIEVMVSPIADAFCHGRPCFERTSVAIPIAAGTTDDWRPRAAKLMWSDPLYRSIMRDTVCLFSEINHDDAPLTDAFCPGADARAVRYGAQSIERAYVIIFYGLQAVESGSVTIPSSLSRTRDTGKANGMSCVADRDSDAARYELLERERSEIVRVFSRLSTVPFGIPGSTTHKAWNRMADAYVLARVAQTRRGSMVSQLAMRVACFVYAMLRHLVPIAPSAAVADVLAQEADLKWKSHSAGFAEALKQCSRAYSQVDA